MFINVSGLKMKFKVNFTKGVNMLSLINKLSLAFVHCNRLCSTSLQILALLFLPILQSFQHTAPSVKHCHLRLRDTGTGQVAQEEAHLH